jgi:hypothetical protein
MTTFRFSLAIAVLASFAVAAPASEPVGTPIHRFVLLQDLRQLCGGDHDVQCSGYVMGIVDTANTIRVAQSKREIVCPPDNALNEEMVASVKKQLEATDLPPDYGAPTAVMQWLAKEYPCKAGTGQ